MLSHPSSTSDSCDGLKIERMCGQIAAEHLAAKGVEPAEQRRGPTVISPTALMAMSFACAFEAAGLGAASAHSISQHSSIHASDDGRSARHASPSKDRL